MSRSGHSLRTNRPRCSVRAMRTTYSIANAAQMKPVCGDDRRLGRLAEVDCQRHQQERDHADGEDEQR
jgi:hypothetical protein